MQSLVPLSSILCSMAKSTVFQILNNLLISQNGSIKGSISEEELDRFNFYSKHIRVVSRSTQHLGKDSEIALVTVLTVAVNVFVALSAM